MAQHGPPTSKAGGGYLVEAHHRVGPGHAPAQHVGDGVERGRLAAVVVEASHIVRDDPDCRSAHGALPVDTSGSVLRGAGLHAHMQHGPLRDGTEFAKFHWRTAWRGTWRRETVVAGLTHPLMSMHYTAIVALRSCMTFLW